MDASWQRSIRCPGVAICKCAVEGLDGTIGVGSSPGEGSRFWFENPVGDQMDVPDSAGAAIAPAEAPRMPRSLHGGRVLLVGDNEMNQRVVTGLLNRMGIEVRTALNGAVALQMVGEKAFDLVLMDYQMPVMNGLDATTATRARGIDVPIIGLTANAFVDDRAACIVAGMDDFIAKLVTRDKLKQSLHRFCRFEVEVAVYAPAIQDDGVNRGQVRALIEDLGSDIVADLLFSYRGDALKLL